MGRVTDTGDWRTSFYTCDEWCDWEGLGSQLADGWYSDEGKHGLDCPTCGNQVEIIRIAPPPAEDLQPLPFPTLSARIEAGAFPSGTMVRFWNSEKHCLIRQRSDQSGSGFPEVWRGSRWVTGSPYVLDAITGMGEDPYSCGEWAEELGPRQAERLARRQAIDLYAPSEDAVERVAAPISQDDTRSYYGTWRTHEFDCRFCKWHGPGSALVQGELYPEFVELLCPTCSEIVNLVMHPTVEEARANSDKLTAAERLGLERIEEFREQFDKRKLRNADQLPQIELNSFILQWDYEQTGPSEWGADTLIKHGESIIFREPAIYEGYERFIEVAEILRSRYGVALQDLIPTEHSRLYLYGDRLSAPQIIAAARQNIFRPACYSDEG